MNDQSNSCFTRWAPNFPISSRRGRSSNKCITAAEKLPHDSGSTKMALFFQKAFEFYEQRQQLGADNYSEFNPQEILKMVTFDLCDISST